MARLNRIQIRRRRNEKAVMALSAFATCTLAVFRLYFFITSTKRRPCPHLSPNPNFYQTQVDNLNRLVRGNESDCYDQLRVNRHTFMRLCFLVRGVGLGDSRYVCLEERVAIFLWIISHHTKQRRTKYEFWRSGETGSTAVYLIVVVGVGIPCRLVKGQQYTGSDDAAMNFVKFDDRSYLDFFGGGVHLAILGAFICQRYPNARLSGLISSFFGTFAFWDWPKPIIRQAGMLLIFGSAGFGFFAGFFGGTIIFKDCYRIS